MVEEMGTDKDLLQGTLYDAMCSYVIEFDHSISDLKSIIDQFLTKQGAYHELKLLQKMKENFMDGLQPEDLVISEKQNDLGCAVCLDTVEFPGR